MTLQETARRIKDLEIQGATSIAIEAVKALGSEVKNLEWEQSEEVVKLLDASIDVLVESRATEPMMRNGLKYMKTRILEEEWSTQIELHDLVQEVERMVLMM